MTVLDPERLRYHMTAKGLSVEGLAKAVDMTPGAIRKNALKGKPVHETNAMAIAAALGVALEVLAMPDSHDGKFGEPKLPPWHLRNPDTVHFVFGAQRSETLPTGLYDRPVVGYGQVLGLVHVVSSLARTYRNVDFTDLTVLAYDLDDDDINRRLVRRDLILSGSPKSNWVTGHFLTQINRFLERKEVVANHESSRINQDGQRVSCEGNRIQIVDMVKDEWNGAPTVKICTTIATRNGSVDQTWEAERNDDLRTVEVDYGLVIKMPNRFFGANDTDNMTFVFAGIHTYGSLAAANWFTQIVEPAVVTSATTGVIAVVETTVKNGESQKPKVRDQLCFDLAQIGWSDVVM